MDDGEPDPDLGIQEILVLKKALRPGFVNMIELFPEQYVETFDKDGNPVVRRPGQLFGQSVGADGKVINDPMKDIGNFAFDMAKNFAGQQLTKDIKNLLL
jgi:hypothetical protein